MTAKYGIWFPIGKAWLRDPNGSLIHSSHLGVVRAQLRIVVGPRGQYVEGPVIMEIDEDGWPTGEPVPAEWTS